MAKGKKIKNFFGQNKIKLDLFCFIYHNKYMELQDNYFMHLAIEQAKIAFKKGDVPIGAVIVKNGKVIGKGYNKKEKKHCSVYHAEIIALKNACKKLKDWRLNDLTLYVTMEPCSMCAGAIVNHRLSRVVIGVTEPNFGACGSGIDILNNHKLNTKVQVTKGVCESECKELLQKFFAERRQSSKNKRRKIC